MKRIVKVFIRLVFVAVPLAIIAIAGGLTWMWRSLPAEDGQISFSGLSAEVAILRDDNGVPHIQAASPNDAFAALGFAHAQDRLWQMEVSRMAGQGRLSEMFGETTIGADKWLRTMGLFDAAVSSLDALDQPTRQALDAYAHGVNAWLDRENRFFASRLPPEFVILGHMPEPWRPEHSVVAIKMMSVTLAANVKAETDRLAFARLGFDSNAIHDLLPPVPGEVPPPLPDLKALLGLGSGPIEKNDVSTAALDFSFVDSVHGTGASNNWVVDGTRTTSGAPLLANDPHLGLAAPSIWYLADLRVDGAFSEPRNLIGTTLPGTPFVLLGRNNDIAWGFTNTASDVQDIFVEKVNPDNPDEYLTPEGWKPFGSKQETIKVRGGEPVDFTRRWTRHGPVLPGSYRKLDTYLPEGTVAAFQWIALASDDTTAVAAGSTFTLSTVGEFQNAMRTYVAPMQSMVVADRSGNIGLIAPGRVPRRGKDNKVMGRAPVPGWLAEYDWQGTISFWQLPRQNNPAGGSIATANSKIVKEDYPHFLTFDWDEPYRQDRIKKLLTDGENAHTPAVSRAIQADVQSDAAIALKTLMLDMIDGIPDIDASVVEQLTAWDGRMGRDGDEPLLFMAWMRETMRGIFADELGPAFRSWFKPRALVLQRVLKGEASRNWCDVVQTEVKEECPAIVANALASALADLEKRFGDARNDWRWGRAHVARSVHRPFGSVPLLARIFNIEVESNGGQFTLDRGALSFREDDGPFINRHASSFRGIYDFADLDRSTYMLTTGQSGNVFSPHYSRFATPWANVEAVEIPADPAAYAGKIEGKWLLQPGR